MEESFFCFANFFFCFRFDKVRTNPKRFALFWFIQAIWIFLTALPVYMVNVQQNEETKVWRKKERWYSFRKGGKGRKEKEI